MVNITVIITASVRPIALMDKMGIDEAVAARTDIEALATAVKALMESIIKDRQFIKEELLEDRQEFILICL